MLSGETDHLTLASGGSERAYLVSVASYKLGIKMNFSLYANMADFCLDNLAIYNALS